MKYLVTVKPNAKLAKVERLSENELCVHVNASPHEGKANKRLIEVLSDYFKVPKTHIAIRSGETSRTKLIDIDQK